MPDFEYDLAKSERNLKKHGINFKQATILWDDERRFIVPARSEDEVRFVLIAMLDQKLWSAIYTIRDDRVRLISVRRSRPEEARIYDES